MRTEGREREGEKGKEDPTIVSVSPPFQSRTRDIAHALFTHMWIAKERGGGEETEGRKRLI